MSNTYDATQTPDVYQAPGGRIGITIRPGQNGQDQADSSGAWQPQAWQPPQQQPQDAQTWQPQQWTPQQQKPQREIGGTEAALRGGVDALSFGFYPAIMGAASGLNAVSEGKDFGPAYEATRSTEEEAQKQAQEQHPYIYGGAEIAGSLPTILVPGLGAEALGAKAATTAGRILNSAKVGAVTGGLFGAGQQTSEGNSPVDVAKGALGGAAAGGALGGTLGAGIEGATGVGNKVLSIVRGQRDPELEAARIVAQTMQGDMPSVIKSAADQKALQAAQEAGTPVTLADLGGAGTKALMRTASNIAPEARDVIGEPVGSRFQQQSDRISRWIRSKFGAIDSDVGTEAISKQARAQNKPLYDAAYRAGENGLWSPKLEQLAGAPAVGQAAQAAAQRGGNRAVAEGMGAFNPTVTFNNGILKISKKGAVPSFPDMQFWDYTQRELRDAAQAAKNSGNFDQADAIGQLHKQLLAELDRINPAFARARGTAAAFFKASDALEAGANFVMDTSISEAKAAKVIAAMKPAERELFARGFAAELASRIERTNYNQNVLNSIFLNNAKAKQRIALALGRDGADQLEALLRIEGLVDKTRRALSNSTTVQQGADASRFATTLGGIEALKGSINPAYLIAAPLLLSGRKAAQEIDQRVYTRVAEMLMSDDPAVFARGLQIAVKNPTVRTALRRAGDVTTRQIVNYFGPAGVAAAGATAVSHLRGSSENEREKYANPYSGDYSVYGNESPSGPH